MVSGIEAALVHFAVDMRTACRMHVVVEARYAGEVPYAVEAQAVGGDRSARMQQDEGARHQEDPCLAQMGGHESCTAAP